MVEYLLSKSTQGRFRFAVVESTEEWNDDVNGYVIQRSYGQVGGKTTMSPPIIVDKAKQKRTFKQQLELQFKSEVKKFLDKGYIKVDKHPNDYSDSELQELYGDVVTNQFGVIKPMLAKKEQDVTNRKIFEKRWLASRKINGVRCLMYWNGNKILTASRGGSDYNHSTTHLTEHPILIEIFKIYPTLILDLELYKFGKSLQQCSGAARLEKNAYDCDWLEMYVYDCYFTDCPEKTADDRINFLKDISTLYNFTFNPIREWNEGELQLQMVPHSEVCGWNNMRNLHDSFVNEGWEGLVIRDPEKAYKPNSRGNQMIKIKQYIDDTFKIVGYELGLRGSEDMVFICEMKDGRTFKASPIGNRAIKQEYVDNFEEKYKNHLGDCKYFELSDEGKPCQPKFISWRFDLE